MSDLDWDADDFEPEDATTTGVATDKWEGEDADDGSKAEAEEGEDGDDSAVMKAVEVKKKRPLKERLAEKETKRKEQLQARQADLEESNRQLTAEEKMVEKLREQQMQEEADLQLAKEAFGESTSEGLIDSFVPDTKEDFEKFAQLLRGKITRYDTSENYIGFLEMLYRDLAVSVDVEDLKKLGATLTTLSVEKAKAQRALKAKKTKAKGKLYGGKSSGFDDLTANVYDAMDDFI